MSTASDIAQTLEGGHFTAFTLEHGYAVRQGGERILFEPGTVTNERRNDRFRVVHTETTYKDGSKLTFDYNESRGHTLTVKRSWHGLHQRN